MADPLSVARSPSFAPKVRGGFALLIVLTLISFLVLLLVGLATYTRIETALAGNTQRQAQARQNALLGFQVALGQLQRHAGPDTRVTATAEAFPNTTGTRHFTGVWSSDSSATATPTTPLTWLVSGNEIVKADGTVDPLAVTPAVVAKSTVELVGRNSSGVSGDVVVPLVDIASAGVPGQAFVAGKPAAAPIGRYGWWVGDQGVKAPVAVPDTSDRVTYAPYGDGTTQNELGKRLRQQIGLGAGAADANGNPVFEPRDANNAPLVADDKIIAPAQLAFLRNASNTALGLTTVQQNFHAWSPNNFAVLANTKLGGLRQDLSLKPDLLGTAFAAWTDFRTYMEDYSAPSQPLPLQPYGADPVRRRYRMMASQSDGEIEHHVAPVLSFFGLSFTLRNDTTTNSPTKLLASARFVIGLWNPYSSALVPEDLYVIVEGLPSVVVESPGAPARTVNIQDRFRTLDGTVKFALKFEPNATDPDRSSWLPGRVYNWSGLSGTADPGSEGYPTRFYQRDSTPAGSGSGLMRDAGLPIGPNTISGDQQKRQCTVSMPQTLTIELRRRSNGEVLGRFNSPKFEPFVTAPTRNPGAAASDFAYVFRLPDREEVPTDESTSWLQGAGRDVREMPFPSVGRGGFVVVAGQPPDPTLLVTTNQAGFPASYSQLLLDRSPTGSSYNEDTPLLELPRAPILSTGVLQHLHVLGARPFSIGNSWGGTRNRWFDQFFFSGLTSGVGWSNPTQALPNSSLKVLPRKSDGVATAVTDVRGSDRLADGYSAKHLMQGGCFNLHSVSSIAWSAVLRELRYIAPNDMTVATLDEMSGTTSVEAGDATHVVEEPMRTRARNTAFFRFPQSAAETFQSTDGYHQSDVPDSSNVANTPLFRRGARALTPIQTTQLATRIVQLLQAKLSTSGPFKSLEEFLSASDNFVSAAGPAVSLIEKAIEDVGLNSDAALELSATAAEFSSQWLTQGDIMTALAPVLFPRSDTFVIRSYGEAVNPATGATEGRAWCEATVQRVPEYFDKTQPEETAPAYLNPLNQRYGRRFKVISFRWLTRSDI